MIGFFIGLLTTSWGNPSQVRVTTAKAMVTLKERGMFVTMDTEGHLWGWDSVNKVSYEIKDPIALVGSK
jgi:pyruvate-formate lyase-activating enzyme